MGNFRVNREINHNCFVAIERDCVMQDIMFMPTALPGVFYLR